MRAAGFTDLWLREAGSVAGLTCCHAPDLSNTEPELDQRLDLVLARAARGAGFGGQSEVTVVGASEDDLFQHSVYGYPLWASDHAGVVARLWPAPGRW